MLKTNQRGDPLRLVFWFLRTGLNRWTAYHFSDIVFSGAIINIKLLAPQQILNVPHFFNYHEYKRYGTIFIPCILKVLISMAVAS